MIYGFPSLVSDLILYNKNLEIISFVPRLVKLVLVDLPRSFHFTGILSVILDYGYYLIAIFVIILGYRKLTGKKKKVFKYIFCGHVATFENK